VFTDACIATSDGPVTWTNSGNHPEADGKFYKAPYFKFNDGKVKFDTNDVDNANKNYGSASAFPPKSLPLSKR